jgi:hypothetical protein
LQLADFRGDHLEHAIEIRRDIGIPEAHDDDTALRHPPITPLIFCLMLRLGMLSAIELDREAQARTIEIKHERTRRMLPPEIRAKLPATVRCANRPPPFRGRWTELAATLNPIGTKRLA